MVSEYRCEELLEQGIAVLILVVVEDGLRVWQLQLSLERKLRVLILVVVEDGLRARYTKTPNAEKEVLILVVVEDGLREICNRFSRRTEPSLNPCCCGRWSQSMTGKKWRALVTCMVLILVVVEDGLRDTRLKPVGSTKRSLNPCCCGRWSQRARLIHATRMKWRTS